MNCGEFEALIAPLLDGDLPEAVAERAYAHLESCPRCQSLLEAADRGTPSTAPSAPPPPDWGALEDALASAAERRGGLTSRLQDWMEEEVHLSRRACFGYGMFAFALVIAVALMMSARFENAAVPVEAESIHPKPTEKASPKTPNRTVF